MVTKIKCTCGVRLQVLDGREGKNVRCPRCDAVWAVPSGEWEDSTPELVQPGRPDVPRSTRKRKRRRKRPEVERCPMCDARVFPEDMLCPYCDGELPGRERPVEAVDMPEGDTGGGAEAEEESATETSPWWQSARVWLAAFIAVTLGATAVAAYLFGPVVTLVLAIEASLVVGAGVLMLACRAVGEEAPDPAAAVFPVLITAAYCVLALSLYQADRLPPRFLGPAFVVGAVVLGVLYWLALEIDFVRSVAVSAITNITTGAVVLGVVMAVTLPLSLQGGGGTYLAGWPALGIRLVGYDEHLQADVWEGTFLECDETGLVRFEGAAPEPDVLALRCRVREIADWRALPAEQMVRFVADPMYEMEEVGSKEEAEAEYFLIGYQLGMVASTEAGEPDPDEKAWAEALHAAKRAWEGMPASVEPALAPLLAVILQPGSKNAPLVVQGLARDAEGGHTYRAGAARLLGQIGSLDGPTTEALVSSALRDEHEDVRKAAAEAIVAAPPESAAPALMEEVIQDNDEARQILVEVLRTRNDYLAEVLRGQSSASTSFRIRIADLALQADLARPADAAPALLKVLEEGAADAALRSRAAAGLAAAVGSSDEVAAALVQRAGWNGRVEVRQAALDVLKDGRSDAVAAGELLAAVAEGNAASAAATCQKLIDWDWYSVQRSDHLVDAVADGLTPALTHKNDLVRGGVAVALGRLDSGDKRAQQAVPTLCEVVARIGEPGSLKDDSQPGKTERALESAALLALSRVEPDPRKAVPAYTKAVRNLRDAGAEAFQRDDGAMLRDLMRIVTSLGDYGTLSREALPDLDALLKDLDASTHADTKALRARATQAVRGAVAKIEAALGAPAPAQAAPAGSDAIEVVVSVDSAVAADRIARALVEKTLAVDVRVYGPVVRVFRRQGEIQSNSQWVCHAKSRRGLFPQVERAIRGLQPDRTPELLALPVVAGSQEYLGWLEQELSKSDGGRR